jgi:hypothetical protein
VITALIAAALQWVVLGPSSEVVIRAVVEAPEAPCPAATIDGAERPLQLRYEGSPWFPVTVCELRLREAPRSASLRGAPLPLPKADAKKIVALGDSGCRVKQADDGSGALDVQDCDGGGWPLQAISAAAAAQRPDLVVHVGDYVYRKAPCPKGDARCAATPAYGATWAAFKAELLEPAEALLRAAPWIVPRGNHETCLPSKPRTSQGGLPFLLLLDPRPLEQLVDLKLVDPYLRALQPGADEEPRPACRELYEPYVVHAGPALDLWVLDSCEADDDTADEDVAERLALQLRRLQALTQPAGRKAWLLTHRPLYGARPGRRTGHGKQRTVVRELNATLQRAFAEAGAPPEVELVLSGHMHSFQAVTFEDGKLPAQLVAGTGGTALDTYFSAVPELLDLGKHRYAVDGDEKHRQPVRGLTLPAFGFALLERGEAAWSAALLDPKGQKLVACSAAAGLRALACKKVAP